MKNILLLLTMTFSVSIAAPYAEPAPKQPSRVHIVLFPSVAEFMERKRIVHCLATMVYGEARGESKQGQIAVAYTAKNRAKSKEKICKEVVRPYQYSVFNGNKKLQTIARNPNLTPPLTNAVDTDSWEDAKIVAAQVYDSTVDDPTHGATHYVAYTLLKRIPSWTYVFKRVGKIEHHTFFKEVTPT